MGVALQAKNKEVEDYCRNWHGWREVLRLMDSEEFESITKKIRWDTNDGQGLEKEDCIELALRLKAPIVKLQMFVDFLQDCEGFEIY